jgi:hypothetical protein
MIIQFQVKGQSMLFDVPDPTYLNFELVNYQLKEFLGEKSIWGLTRETWEGIQSWLIQASSLLSHEVLALGDLEVSLPHVYRAGMLS